MEVIQFLITVAFYGFVFMVAMWGLYLVLMVVFAIVAIPAGLVVWLWDKRGNK